MKFNAPSTVTCGKIFFLLSAKQLFRTDLWSQTSNQIVSSKGLYWRSFFEHFGYFFRSCPDSTKGLYWRSFFENIEVSSKHLMNPSPKKDCTGGLSSIILCYFWEHILIPDSLQKVCTGGAWQKINLANSILPRRRREKNGIVILY